MAKVLNYGALNIDFVYRVPHFVCPGETISSLGLVQNPGGKGLNQSVALALAGAAVFHAGAVGEDGGFLVELLREKGVDVSRIRSLPGRTGHAVIQVEDGGQNCIILYGGANRAQTPDLDALDGFSPGDWLLLQNEVSGNAALMAAAHEKGMKLALNPSPFDRDAAALPLELADLFFVNEVEGEGLTGCHEPKQILSALRERFPAAQIVLTIGSGGVLALDGSREYRHGIYRVPVVDTTAAGDTFTGFFLAALCRGEGMDKALELASRASSLAVSRMGAAASIPTLREVWDTPLSPA